MTLLRSAASALSLPCRAVRTPSAPSAAIRLAPAVFPDAFASSSAAVSVLTASHQETLAVIFPKKIMAEPGLLMDGSALTTS